MPCPVRARAANRPGQRTGPGSDPARARPGQRTGPGSPPARAAPRRAPAAHRRPPPPTQAPPRTHPAGPICSSRRSDPSIPQARPARPAGSSCPTRRLVLPDPQARPARPGCPAPDRPRRPAVCNLPSRPQPAEPGCLSAPQRRGPAHRGGPMATIFLYEIAGTAMLTLLGGGVVANNVLGKTKGNGGGWLLINFGWGLAVFAGVFIRSEEHTSELQSRGHLVCRLLLEKKKDRRDA